MTKTNNGKFIVFEGLDGSGKSTQVNLLSNSLLSRGYEPYKTFEPTESPIGKLIRQILYGEIAAQQKTIACLFAADRTDHLVNKENGIKLKLDQGKIVLCDRYYFSSYAYDGQHPNMDSVIQLNELNAKLLRPDLTIFIDVNPKRCLKRIIKRGYTLGSYEKIDSMKKARKNYFKAFKKLKKLEKIKIINGEQEQDNVADDIWLAVQECIREQS